ncbi:esterase/lipase family protein [Halobacteriales archaeon Cl-PHB]
MPRGSAPTRRQVLQAIGATGLGAAATVPAGAEDYDGEALAGFGGTSCDVDRTDDRYLPWETNGSYGGWGGHEYHHTKEGTDENPIVFVHGNTHDACDLSKHAEEYLSRGYRGDALWSITFKQASPKHPEMRDQLDDFVGHVRDYTGHDTVDVVSHSLGVTGVRFWMDDADRYDWADTFVGCAGANEGTYTCGPTCTAGTGSSRPCGFISPDCADDPGDPLYELNHPDETPGDGDYYTIRGSADYFYSDNPDSPVLRGADQNVLFQGAAHNATRASDLAVELIFQWTTDGPVPGPDGDVDRTDYAASGSRSDGGTDLYVAGDTATMSLSVDAEKPAVLRDVIPYEWDVVHSDEDDVEAVAPKPYAGVKYVYFQADPAKHYDVSYTVQAPASAGTYEFGPAEVQRSGRADWQDVSGTTDENEVVLGK